MRAAFVLAAAASDPSDLWQSAVPVAVPGSHEECRWVEILHYVSTGGAPYRQCVRQGAALLSQILVREGRWPDCDVLARLWNETSQDGVFVDAGANIGSCSLMMLSLGAPTIAFEPLPVNNFYFTTSVLANPGMRERLKLYQHGLGNASARVDMYSDPQNRGNSVVGQAIGDTPAQEKVMRTGNFTGPARLKYEHEVRGSKVTRFENISIKTLDDALWPVGAPRPRPIRLMKVDVQGFEPQVFSGATRLIAAGLVRTVKVEVARKHLQRQQGSKTAVLEFLRQVHGLGFDLTFEDGRLISERGALHHALARFGGSAEVVGRYNSSTSRPPLPADLGRPARGHAS